MISDSGSLRRIVAESKLVTRLQMKAGAVVALVTPETMELIEVGVGVDASTPMEIGSLTKVFTALLLADVIGRDKLKLSDRIDHVLLGLSWTGAPAVTIEELATHTSGLPRLSFGVLDALRSDPYRSYTRENLLAWIGNKQPRSPANPTFSYSNFGYAVLGLALERASLQTFEHLLQDRLLRPLEMNRTALQLAGGGDLVSGGYKATGHRASPWLWDAYAPCGAMVSTLGDMAAAARSFLDVNSPIATALALTTEPRATVAGGSIGLGWLLPATGDAYWHNGATAGYSSYLGVNTQTGMAAIILANQAQPREMTELGAELMRLIRAASTVGEGAE